MRVALYLRVSSPRQRENISLTDQLDICTRHAVAQGWVVTAVYEEAGRSAFTERVDRRPALQRLLADARGRKFDVALVYKLNRFARKVLVQYQLAADLERCGVQVTSATEPIDRKTASGRITFGVLAVLAEGQSDALSEKMRDTWAAIARQGRHVGPVPVGYQRGADGRLELTEAADGVRFLGERYATGTTSVAAAADHVNAAGYRMPDGRLFSALAAEEMIGNPVYAGHVCHRGQIVVRDAHPPIWPAELWTRMQEVRAQRSWRKTKTEQAHHGALVGLARCGACGGTMWHHPTSAGGRYYHCASGESGRPTGHPDLLCTAGWVRAEAVEAATIGWAAGAVLTPDALDIARKALSQPKATPATTPSRSEIDERLRRLARAYADGAYDDSEYAARRAKLLALASEATEPSAPAVDLEHVLAALRDLADVLTEATPAERRAILGQMISEVYVRRSGVLALRPTQMAAPLLEAAALSSRWQLTIGPQCGPGGDLAQIPDHWLTLRPIMLAA